jgi:DNA-binding CsgD family transcriptional regulator
VTARPESLTTRDVEALRHASRGLTPHQIAARMGTTTAEAHTRLSGVLDRLDATRVADAVTAATRAGVMAVEDGIGVLPDVDQVRARREHRWDEACSNPEFWAWLSADARRLASEHADVYGPAGVRVLAGLSAVAGEVGRWREDAASSSGRRGPRFAPEEHGTERGYQQHRSRKIRFCDRCRVAHAAHQRARDAEKRAGAAS